jgi:SAM-dependent methyltransferase
VAEYILDRGWEPERRRLELQERTLDPITFDHLERIGVGEGWRCLELGAGAGSVVRWLADRVGPTGAVVAIDLDTKLVEQLEGPVIEVRQEDLMTADLSEDFDLVHCRLLLVHLAEKEAALRRMYGAVRPGGWLLAEESDSLYSIVDDPPTWPRPKPGTSTPGPALTRLWHETGFDPWWGRNLLTQVCELGARNIAGEVRSPLLDGEYSELQRLMLERFRDQMIERGYATEVECAAWEANTRHPDWKAFLWFLASVWGQKPTA